MFISLFVFLIVCGILGKTRICAVYILFVYICIAVSVVTRGGLYPNNWFNPATYLCLSQARIWISGKCRGLFCASMI